MQNRSLKPTLASSLLVLSLLNTDLFANCRNLTSTISFIAYGGCVWNHNGGTLSIAKGGTLVRWAAGDGVFSIAHTRTINLLTIEEGGTIEQGTRSHSYMSVALKIGIARGFRAHAGTIDNKGMIMSPAQPAIWIGGGTITLLTNHSTGTIKGGIQTGDYASYLKTLNNAGLITNAKQGQLNAGYAVHNNGAKDIVIINSGTIEGYETEGQVQNFSNTGAITGNGLSVRSTIKTLTLGNNSTINNGIELRGTIQSLTNDSSTLKITNHTRGQIQNLQGNGTITSLDNKGTIRTLNNTMNGQLTNSGKIESGSITFQSGQLTNQQNGTIGGTVSGTITSLDNKGTIRTLNNTMNGQLTNSGKIESGSITFQNGQLTNNTGGTISGTISGTITSLDNQGTIATIEGKNIDRLYNEGRVQDLTVEGGNFKIQNRKGQIGSLKIKGNAQVEIDNPQNIGSQDGVATITVESGAPQVVFDEISTGVEGQAAKKAVHISGSSGSSGSSGTFKTRRAVITQVSKKTDPSKAIQLDQIVTPQSVTIESATYSQELKDSGFKGTYDQTTNLLSSNFNANLAAGGLIAQLYTNRLNRRSLFYGSVLNEASRASIRYKITQPKTEFDIFARPYGSKLKAQLDGTDSDAIGDSKGVIAGGHHFSEYGLLALYGIVEKSDTKLNERVFNATSDTFMGGLKYSVDWFSNDIMHFYYGVNTRLGYTHINAKRNVANKQSEGNTNIKHYEGKAFLGSVLYYDPEDRTEYINHEFGFGNLAGRIAGFDMKGGAYEESLESSNFNTFYSQMNVAWFKRWAYGFATQLDGSFRWNINPDVNTQAKINSTNFYEDFDISKFYTQLGSSVLWINPGGVDVSLGYKILFGQKSHSHNLSLRLHKTF